MGDAESRDKFEYIDERTANIKKLQECTSHYDLCDQGNLIVSSTGSYKFDRKSTDNLRWGCCWTQGQAKGDES